MTNPDSNTNQTSILAVYIERKNAFCLSLATLVIKVVYHEICYNKDDFSSSIACRYCLNFVRMRWKYKIEFGERLTKVVQGLFVRETNSLWTKYCGNCPTKEGGQFKTFRWCAGFMQRNTQAGSFYS